MPHTIKLIRGATRLQIPITPADQDAHYIQAITRGNLTDYDFNPRFKRMIPTKRYLLFDTEKSILTVPVTLTDGITGKLDDIGRDYLLLEEPFPESRPITVKMKDSFVPREHQIPVIDHLKQSLPYRKGLSIQTGSGKTVSSIAGMIAYGAVGMVVVSGLCDQWIRSIHQFTTAKPEQIAKIQGFDSLFEVLKSEAMPEIFVFSLETLRAYCLRIGHYAELPPFQEFVKYFGIGYKIMDEVHKAFHACTMIDLSCNIPNNVYLTATFTSGNPGTRRIFNMIYPKSMRFGSGVIKKYTDAYCYKYVGSVPERKCMTPRGYSHLKYELYLLRRPTLLKEFFDFVLSPLVYSHYINKKTDGQKLAVFFSRLEMVDYAYKWFTEQFPEMSIVRYIGGVQDKVLADNEIIITTMGSLGCGSDVQNLRTVINTVSTKSPPAVLQLFGRLRELEGSQTDYVDICDTAIPAHERHRKERELWLHSVCKSYTTLTLG